MLNYLKLLSFVLDVLLKHLKFMITILNLLEISLFNLNQLLFFTESVVMNVLFVEKSFMRKMNQLANILEKLLVLLVILQMNFVNQLLLLTLQKNLISLLASYLVFIHIQLLLILSYLAFFALMNLKVILVNTNIKLL